MNNESISSKSKTDWVRLDAMSDEDIDRSDCPEVTPEMFTKAVVRRAPKPQTTVTLKIDSDVLEWFQSQGDSAESQMAIALKIYAEANKAYLTN
ncbi:MAG: BrnA antitoxin family protein [Rivularia sp. (in: cyanobacteria)]